MAEKASALSAYSRDFRSPIFQEDNSQTTSLQYAPLLGESRASSLEYWTPKSKNNELLRSRLWYGKDEMRTVEVGYATSVEGSNFSSLAFCAFVITQILSYLREGSYGNFLRSGIAQHHTEVASVKLFEDHEAKLRSELTATTENFVRVLADVCDIQLPVSGSWKDDPVRALTLLRLYRKYDAVVYGTLEGAGFKPSNPDFDQFGDLIVDFFRGNDRITMALSDDSIQILLDCGGEFSEFHTASPHLALVQVNDFIRGKVG